MSVTGIVENDMVKLPIHVPDGTHVEITLPNPLTVTRRSGLHAGVWEVSPDFDAPLADEFWLGERT
jgi:hypothetical protein